MMAFLTGLRLEEQGLGGSFVVGSAGTKATDGDRLCVVAAEHVETHPTGGEFVDRHRACRVTRDLLDEAGLILVASSRERAAIAGPSQDARPKTFTMVEAAQLAQAAAERGASPRSARGQLTLQALGAAMRDQRDTMAQGSRGPLRGLLSRGRSRSLDVADVHLGEARSHAPAIESLEWASSVFAEAVGRLAGP